MNIILVKQLNARVYSRLKPEPPGARGVEVTVCGNRPLCPICDQTDSLQVSVSDLALLCYKDTTQATYYGSLWVTSMDAQKEYLLFSDFVNKTSWYDALIVIYDILYCTVIAQPRRPTAEVRSTVIVAVAVSVPTTFTDCRPRIPSYTTVTSAIGVFFAVRGIMPTQQPILMKKRSQDQFF